MARLLLIDTDHEFLQRCQSIFMDAGHEVVTADGHSALDEFTHFKPDAIILEIDLGDVNGLDVMAKILGKNRRVVCLLNPRHDAYRDHFLTWAADGYALKSPDLHEFAAWVECILSERGVVHEPECVGV